MATTRTPAPVDVGTSATTIPLSQIDRGPTPVDVPTVSQTVPRSQVDRTPATVPTSSDPALAPSTKTVSRPVTVLSSSGNASANSETPALVTVESNTSTNVTVQTPLYLSVSEDGTVVIGKTNYINFTGSGVTVTNTNGTATIDISSGGGGNYGNSNVVTLLSAFGSNTISTTGNITASYLLGNGSQLTGISANYGNSNVSVYLASGTNSSNIITTSNVTGANLTTGGVVSATGNVRGANFNTTGIVSATGNITANYFIGNGSQLTGISASANTGNIGFIGDAIYDLNGMIIENADLSHGATAAVIIPANGNTTAPVQINNTYGNITLGIGPSGTITSTWAFDTDGNLTVPANMIMQTTQTGFPFSSAVAGITTGESTVSVLIADSIFPGPVTGQVYIAGVVGTTEANDTWWFQANESDSIELFTDSTFSTPVDGTTWTAYENGGFAVSTGSADLQLKGGNVSITGGTWTWTFDATGNLSLPGGGSIENRDNLSILITNATVLDGEITLEANAAVNIYGGSTTTAGSAGGRVNVAGGDGGPDDGDNAGNGGEVEITGGSGASAINGSAGAGGDVRIVGGLGGAANAGNSLPAETGGQVYIFGGQAGDVDGDNALAINGPDVEIHGGLGSFNGSTMVGIPGDVITQGGGDGWIGASGNVITKTSPDGYDFYTWKYDNAGQTIYPVLFTQRGDVTSGTISGSTIRIGDGTQEAIITTPDAPAESNGNSQRLVINPGQGDGAGEGGDIYLWAGRGGSASGSGGDIKIRGGQGGANTSGGTGGAGGYIRMEAGDAASVGGDPGYIEITAGSGGSGSPGGYVHILAGTGATGGGEANLTGGYAQNGAGGQVNITGGISADGLGSYGNVVVSAGASGWTFNNAGVLLLPNGDTINNGAWTGTASSTVSLNAVSPDGNTVSFQAQGNSSLAVIQTYSDGTDTEYNWAFDNTGILTFPDSTVMGTVEGAGTFGFYNANANTSFLIELGSTSVWSFNGATGITGLPDNTLQTGANVIIQTPNGVPGAVTAITGSSGSWESNPVTDLATTGGTGSGLTVNVTQEGGYAGTIAIATAGTGYSDGDTITVTSGSSNATFTISVLANTWTFGTDGNFALNGSDIAGSTSTVVTDGINSISLSLGAQMDLFGFPFTVTPTRGQLTITGDISTTQALGTWYYQSVNSYTYQLYTDSTYTTKVDASGWTAYTGGGSVAITLQGAAANIVINSNGFESIFTNNGSLNLPGSLTAFGDFGTDGDIYGNNIAATGIVKTGVYTIASLPSASEVGAGARAFVTDADSNVFGTIYGGDSGNSVPVWSNGANWYIG